MPNMLLVKIGQVNDKETLVGMVRNNAELQSEIQESIVTDFVKEVWICCAVMEEPSKPYA